MCVSHSVVSDFCDPMDCSSPGSSVHEILQARILEWVAILFSRRSSQPRDWIQVYCIAGRFLTIWPTLLISYISSVAQSCPTLCDSMDCSTPGFLVQHQLPELAQTQVHQVSDAIHFILCCSHLLLPSIFPSISVFFQGVSSSPLVAKVLEFQHQSFQWIFRTDFL